MEIPESTQSLTADIIARWESITINKLNEQIWRDNKEKLAYIENLLGENEKRMWQQWRTAYPEAYENLTKQQVLSLAQEIAIQPKLIEEEALKLTEDLKQKVQRVEELLQEVKTLILS